MTFKYRHRKQIILIFFLVLIIIGISTGIYLNFNNKKDKDSDKEDIIVEKKQDRNSEQEKEKSKIENTLFKVDIKGEINNPGIYSLKESSRVIDVIDLAGGLTENADTSIINLSKKIKDEMVIIIYSREQVENFIETKERENYLQNKCRESDENALENDACISDGEQINSKVNINTASLEELMTLNGIGEAKANEIISYREANGGFTSIEEIMNISGIGENIYVKIKENITT